MTDWKGSERKRSRHNPGTIPANRGKLPSRHILGGTEENHKEKLRRDVLADIRTEHLRKTSLGRYITLW
jgi:hypothetical protein